MPKFCAAFGKYLTLGWPGIICTRIVLRCVLGNFLWIPLFAKLSMIAVFAIGCVSTYELYIMPIWIHNIIIISTLQLQHCRVVRLWVAFTFQEFAIGWSQPPNKTRWTASWGSTRCLAWSLPWQPSCCASWWLWWNRFRRHVIIFVEILREAGWTHFFWGDHGSMAGWPLSIIVRWWAGVSSWAGLERDYCPGDLRGRMVVANHQRTMDDDPMWFCQLIWLRWGQALGLEWYETRIAVKNHKCSLDFDSETTVPCFFVQTCESMKANVTCLQFPHPHGNAK